MIDKSHPMLSTYWQTLSDNWISEYQTNKHDYVKDMFIKLVGMNFYKFILSYNKRMRLDIDSVPGLSDFIFGDENENLNKSVSEIFFINNGFRLMNPNYYDDEQKRDIDNPPYRRESIYKYFDTGSHGYFDRIDECKEFTYRRFFGYAICDSDRMRYSSGNAILNDMVIWGDTYNIPNIIQNLKFSCRNVIDDNGRVRQTIHFRIHKMLHIRIEYVSEEVNNNRNNSYFRVDNNTLKYNSGYSDLYRLCDDTVRCIHIKSNLPLFTDEQCKFFHVLEKLHHYPNSFMDKYCENFSPDNPETQFIDQLCIKYFWIGNDTINSIFEFLNSTRPRSYKYESDSMIPAKFADWIRPQDGRRNEVYDRYDSNTFYNVELQEHFPMWLDLKYRSIIENLINCYNYSPRANERLDDQNRRLENLIPAHDINDIIDTCNLRRESYFQELVKKYKSYK